MIYFITSTKKKKKKTWADYGERSVAYALNNKPSKKYLIIL